MSEHPDGSCGRNECRREAHRNAWEAFFRVLRWAISGIFHHRSEKYMNRHLKEFDFRYNIRRRKDGAVACVVLRGVDSKRLFYKD